MFGGRCSTLDLVTQTQVVAVQWVTHGQILDLEVEPLGFIAVQREA